MNLYQISNAHLYLTKSGNELSYSLAGRLQLAQTGWLVLAVPAALVRGAFDALHEEGVELPDQYAIPVLAPEELGDVERISERGHTFHFTMGPVRTFEPNRGGLSKTWYIQIYSPELKRFRHSYGLDAHLKNTNSFQLPIAIRKSGVLSNNQTKKSSLEDPDWNEYTLDPIEKEADIEPSTYKFTGDTQGVGLRKTLHRILDDRKLPGLAYNDARANETLVTLGGKPKVRDNVLRELHNYLRAREAQYKMEQILGTDHSMTPVNMDQNAITQMLKGQGFTSKPPEDPIWKEYLMKRYRLKPQNGSLVGLVPSLAAKQLQGLEPMYKSQLDPINEYGPTTFGNK